MITDNRLKYLLPIFLCNRERIWRRGKYLLLLPPHFTLMVRRQPSIPPNIYYYNRVQRSTRDQEVPPAEISGNLSLGVFCPWQCYTFSETLSNFIISLSKAHTHGVAPEKQQRKKRDQSHLAVKTFFSLQD